MNPARERYEAELAAIDAEPHTSLERIGLRHTAALAYLRGDYEHRGS